MIYCHVSGGWDDSLDDLDTILVYNPDTEGWSPAGRMREESWACCDDDKHGDGGAILPVISDGAEVRSEGRTVLSNNYCNL